MTIPILPWVIGIAGLFGLLIGSFLNVVIWRVPRRESIVPGSRCPSCGVGIRPVHNVPVLSWIALRARCASCRAPISVRYPLVELATGAVFALVTWWWACVSAWRMESWSDGRLIGAEASLGGILGAWIALIAYLWFASMSIALSVIDAEHQRLPNAIVFPSYAVVIGLLSIASMLSGSWERLGSTLGGAVVFGGCYVLVSVIYPRGIGGGDVKLAPVCGAAMGSVSWGALLVGGFAGFLFSAVLGLSLIALRRATWKTGLPFGPFLLAGSWIGMLWGDVVILGYLGFLGIR